MQLENANYNPKRFSALIIKNIEPIRATALLFANGRLVCVGAKSSLLAKEATKIFAQKIAYVLKESSTEITTALDTFKIQNVVASFKFPKTLNLPALYDTLRIAPSEWFEKHISFNQEIFPGMCLRIKNNKIVVLLFTTGKCIITGARKEEDILNIYPKITETISIFMKN
uniref:TATA-box-binding protein n=1 Tax=Meloidogyne hapla TaxID=6305 RepID=A0A1I8C2B3_MELHA